MLEVIETNISEAIDSPAFLDIPKCAEPIERESVLSCRLRWHRESLRTLLSSDKLDESEVNLFKALLR